MEGLEIVLIGVVLRCSFACCWSCVDDSNSAVDWLIIYKPPSDYHHSILKESQYVYISSANPEAQWIVGDLEKPNALYSTLAPLKKVRREEVAAVVYDRRPHQRGSDGTAAMGVLLANKTGGLWLMHTVPNFPNLASDYLELPPAQMHVGQMFFCINLQLSELNQIGLVLQDIRPMLVYLKVPRDMSTHLPDWINIKKHYDQDSSNPLIKRYDIKVKAGVPLTVIYRTPNLQQCMYRTFAESFGVMLDVYAKMSPITHPPICTDIFGVRQLENISLKILLEDIHYINRKMDNTRFAITAAVHWQHVGQEASFWACFSNVDNDDSATGAMLVCLEDFAVWNSMFMLKNAEPLCPGHGMDNNNIDNFRELTPKYSKQKLN